MSIYVSLDTEGYDDSSASGVEPGSESDSGSGSGELLPDNDEEIRRILDSIPKEKRQKSKEETGHLTLLIITVVGQDRTSWVPRLSVLDLLLNYESDLMRKYCLVENSLKTF